MARSTDGPWTRCLVLGSQRPAAAPVGAAAAEPGTILFHSRCSLQPWHRWWLPHTGAAVCVVGSGSGQQSPASSPNRAISRYRCGDVGDFASRRAPTSAAPARFGHPFAQRLRGCPIGFWSAIIWHTPPGWRKRQAARHSRLRRVHRSGRVCSARASGNNSTHSTAQG